MAYTDAQFNTSLQNPYAAAGIRQTKPGYDWLRQGLGDVGAGGRQGLQAAAAAEPGRLAGLQGSIQTLQDPTAAYIALLHHMLGQAAGVGARNSTALGLTGAGAGTQGAAAIDANNQANNAGNSYLSQQESPEGVAARQQALGGLYGQMANGPLQQLAMMLSQVTEGLRNQSLARADSHQTGGLLSGLTDLIGNGLTGGLSSGIAGLFHTPTSPTFGSAGIKA